MIKIKAKDVDVFYGKKQALFNISLDIDENQVTALIGPSGCGKSTFLRCLNRMNDVIDICSVKGEILINDFNINDKSCDVVRLREKIGMVFQKPNPFPKTLYENVSYGPTIHGMAQSKQEMDEIVETSLKKAALWEEVKDRLHEPGTGLSGGQQQRLCIARAISVRPEVILMDEPCSALDPIATAQIEELIDELKKEHTIIIVTHSMAQAARVSQNTGFFHLGQLIEHGSTDKIFKNPDNKKNARLYNREVWIMSEAPHTVKSYEEELKNLNANIVKMGSACEDALGKAIQAITTRNSDIAENVIQDDEKIDKYEALIEQQVVNLIALRQPMAIDLRETVTALKMSSDLERIGDLAKNISKRTLLLNENLPKNLVDSLNRVSTNVQKQLKSTLDAYLERSAPIAVNVWEGDEQIDDLTNLCMQDVIKYLKDNEKNLEDGTHLLFVTKNVERIGDHTTNVAEQIYYLVKGEYLEGDRPKGTEPIVTGEK